MIWVTTQFINTAEYISLVFYYTQQQRKDENQSNAEMVKAVNIMLRISIVDREKPFIILSVKTRQNLHFPSINWCKMHDFPVPALPITRNLKRKSENCTNETEELQIQETNYVAHRHHVT